MKLTKTLAAVCAVLALAACNDPTKKGGGTRQLSPADMYRSCVGTDHDQQNHCQIKIFGHLFSEDDQNWVCDSMGNWQCGPTEKRA